MINHYKLAPTFLFKESGESKLFNTQEAVDRAWGEGWFGPPWLLKDNPLISAKEWATKDDLKNALAEDPRYKGIKGVSPNKNTFEEMLDKVSIFEIENELK